MCALEQIDTSLFRHPYRWIIFTENDTILRSIEALVDSDVLIPQASNDGSGGGDRDDVTATYNLKQFYKIEENSPEIYYEHYGMWSSQSGIVDERKSTVISRRRANLRGKLITSSYVYLNASSRAHLTDFVDKHVDSILKVNYMMVNTLLDTMNVSKRELFQQTWGYFNARSRKWSGMVGDLVHNGADIGGNNATCVWGANECVWVCTVGTEIYDYI